MIPSVLWCVPALKDNNSKGSKSSNISRKSKESYLSSIVRRMSEDFDETQENWFHFEKRRPEFVSIAYHLTTQQVTDEMHKIAGEVAELEQSVTEVSRFIVEKELWLFDIYKAEMVRRIALKTLLKETEKDLAAAHAANTARTSPKYLSEFAEVIRGMDANVLNAAIEKLGVEISELSTSTSPAAPLLIFSHKFSWHLFCSEIDRRWEEEHKAICN